MITVYHILCDLPEPTLRVTFIDCAYYSLTLSFIFIFDFNDFSLKCSRFRTHHYIQMCLFLSQLLIIYLWRPRIFHMYFTASLNKFKWKRMLLMLLFMLDNTIICLAIMNFGASGIDRTNNKGQKIWLNRRAHPIQPRGLGGAGSCPIDPEQSSDGEPRIKATKTLKTFGISTLKQIVSFFR